MKQTSDERVRHLFADISRTLVSHADWNTKNEAIERLSSLAECGGLDDSALTVGLFKPLLPTIIYHLEQLHRTSVVLTVLRLLTLLTTHLSRSKIKRAWVNLYAEHLLLPTLSVWAFCCEAKLKDSSNECLNNLLHCLHSVPLLTQVLECLTHRHSGMRVKSAEMLLLALQQWDRSEFVVLQTDIEVQIRSSLTDPADEVRALARQCYWEFCRSFPEGARRISHGLDVHAQRFLYEAGQKMKAASEAPKNSKKKRPPGKPIKFIYTPTSAASIALASLAQPSAPSTAVPSAHDSHSRSSSATPYGRFGGHSRTGVSPLRSRSAQDYYDQDDDGNTLGPTRHSSDARTPNALSSGIHGEFLHSAGEDEEANEANEANNEDDEDDESDVIALQRVKEARRQLGLPVTAPAEVSSATVARTPTITRPTSILSQGGPRTKSPSRVTIVTPPRSSPQVRWSPKQRDQTPARVTIVTPPLEERLSRADSQSTRPISVARPPSVTRPPSGIMPPSSGGRPLSGAPLTGMLNTESWQIEPIVETRKDNKILVQLKPAKHTKYVPPAHTVTAALLPPAAQRDGRAADGSWLTRGHTPNIKKGLGEKLREIDEGDVDNADTDSHLSQLLRTHHVPTSVSPAPDFSLQQNIRSFADRISNRGRMYVVKPRQDHEEALEHGDALTQWIRKLENKPKTPKSWETVLQKAELRREKERQKAEIKFLETWDLSELQRTADTGEDDIPTEYDSANHVINLIKGSLTLNVAVRRRQRRDKPVTPVFTRNLQKDREMILNNAATATRERTNA